MRENDDLVILHAVFQSAHALVSNCSGRSKIMYRLTVTLGDEEVEEYYRFQGRHVELKEDSLSRQTSHLLPYGTAFEDHV
jgi:hypothetical protein